MDYQTTVITYGGGEILDKVFNGIAMLTGGDGIITMLCGLTLFLGVAMGIFKAYLGDYEGVNFRKYLLPIVVLSIVCFTPKSTVHIEDIFRNRAYNVSNVPIVLAQIAELVSSCGYAVTRGFEDVMHQAGDQYYRFTPGTTGGANPYLSSGMIFGAESILDLNRYKIANGDLEQNMQKFAKQCVLYDLAHRRYTFEEIKTATDLWGFLKKRTSDLRMIRYTPVTGEKSDKESYLTCKEALNKLEAAFGAEKARISKNELLKHLPFAFKVLTGANKDANELISQQLMISFLSSNFSGPEFANIRAQAQQKSTYLVLGSLASSSLVTMRAILEALIYVAFLFVMPLSLLPKGLMAFKSWFQLLVWIQLWTPLYAVINYIQQVAAHSHASSLFPSAVDKTLTIVSSIGLEQLHQDIYALGGYLAISIPFLSYAIVYGGASSFVQMAGSLMTPAHSAATSSAGEFASGNYSLANTNYGQVHYKNSSMLQQQSSPALSYGYMTENRGSHSLTYAEGKTIFNEALSTSRYNLDTSESLSGSMSNQLQTAQSAVDTSQKSYSESISNHIRNMADITEHFGSSKSVGGGFSTREAAAMQESANFVYNEVEQFANQHNMSTREGFDFLVSVSPKLFGIGGGATLSKGNYSDEVLSNGKNLASSEDFQKHLQTVRDISMSGSFNISDDHGKRLVNAYTESLDQVASEQQSYSAALSNMESVTQTNAWIEQNSVGLRENLNQEFFDFVSQEVGGTAKAAALFNDGSSHLSKMAEEFMEQKYSTFREMAPLSPVDKYASSDIPSLAVHVPSLSEMPGYGEFMTEKEINSRGEAFEDLYNRSHHSIDSSIKESQEQRLNHLEQLSGKIAHSSQFSSAEKAISDAVSSEFVQRTFSEGSLAQIVRGAGSLWTKANEAAEGFEKGTQMVFGLSEGHQGNISNTGSGKSEMPAQIRQSLWRQQ